MRTVQHAIKIFALALAFVITISIFGAMLGGIYLAGTILTGFDYYWNSPGETSSIYESSADETSPSITQLDISIKASNVKFRRSSEGDSVRVETNNEYITTWIDGHKLNIVEKSHGIFGFGETGDIIIYVHDQIKFDSVTIEIGAGTLTMDTLETKTLDLELGAGKVNINELQVSERARIKGGAGKTTISAGELVNADIELGAGKTELRAKLLGDNHIEADVGKLDLTLLGAEDDYELVIDKGLGSVNVSGHGLSDGARYGNGDNRIELESGVGAIDITFEQG